MSTYTPSFLSHLMWGLDFLINHVLFHHRMLHLPETFNRLYGGGAHSNEEVEECAICLSKIEDDDEIRELKCDHLFHRNCLDTWLSYRHMTCPLCRDNLVVPPKIDGGCEIGSQEVLFFDFCRTASNDDEPNWWLR